MAIDLLLIPKLLSLKSRIEEHLATGLSVKNVTDLALDHDVITLFEDLGSRMLPAVAPELRVVAAIATSYDTNNVKWVQAALNRLVAPSPPLAVDGFVGPKTIAAAMTFQKQAFALFGVELKVDGWIGDKSRALIQRALVALEEKGAT